MENFRLRVFRTVARLGNLRMAAEELRLTQPAVTQQVKALEAEVDAALFDRAGGRVRLTEAGEALLPYADRMAVMADEARTAVAEAVGSRAGELRIAASQTIAQYVLPRLVAGFVAENPRVEVEVRSGNTTEVLEELAAHRVHVALIEGPALRQDVRLLEFLEDHMVCVAAAGHAWAGREVGVEELSEAVWVTREVGSGSRRVVEQGLEAAGVPVRELRVRMAFDTTEGLLGGVEAGLGLAFCSRWAVRSRLAMGTVGVVRVRGLRMARMFALATVAGPEPAGVTGAFRRFVLERAEGMAAMGAVRVRGG